MKKVDLIHIFRKIRMVGGILMMMVSCSFASGINNGALHDAVEAQDYQMLESLLTQENVEVDIVDFQMRTALMMAVQRNDAQAAELLINAGANVNIKNSIQDTPYLLAGAEGYNQILMMILKSNPLLEDTNRYGGTAIIPAAEKGHLETVKILLDAGINPNHINNLGWTALMEAVLLGDGSPIYVDIVDTLMQAGADPNIPDKKGMRALRYAKERGFKAMQLLLEQNGGRE